MARTFKTDAEGNLIPGSVEPAADLPDRVANGRAVARKPAPAPVDPQRKAEVAARRTAILDEVRERRRKSRDEDRQAKIAHARTLFGPLDQALKIDWLPANTLSYPPEYQRVFDDDKAMKYAMDFNPNMFGTIAVNIRPDGFRAMLDGQHRVFAAQLVHGDDVLVPCVVTYLKTSKEEAEAWDGYNNARTQPVLAARFRAAVHAEKEAPLEVLLVLREFDLRPLWEKESRTTPNTVAAIRSVQYMADTAGATSARAVVGILHEVGGGDPAWYRDFILNGTWQFLMRYEPYLRRDRLVTVLKGLDDPKTLDKLAAGNRTMVNGSISYACCAAIHALYNANEHGPNRLPDWTIQSTTRAGAIIREGVRAWRAKYEVPSVPWPVPQAKARRPRR